MDSFSRSKKVPLSRQVERGISIASRIGAVMFSMRCFF